MAQTLTTTTHASEEVNTLYGNNYNQNKSLICHIRAPMCKIHSNKLPQDYLLKFPQYQAPYRPPMQQASSQKKEWRVAFEAMTSAQNKFIASQNQFMNLKPIQCQHEEGYRQV